MNVIDHNYALKIDLFIKEMNEIDSNEYFHQNRIRFASYLIDAVHAIADCYERHKNQLSGTDKEFVLAFCYLNNQLKHDRQLEVFSTQFYSAVLPLICHVFQVPHPTAFSGMILMTMEMCEQKASVNITIFI